MTVKMSHSGRDFDFSSLKCDNEETTAESTLSNKLQLVRSMQSQILVTIQDVSSRLTENPFSYDLWQLLLTLSHCGCEQVAFEDIIRSQNSEDREEDLERQADRVGAMLDRVFTLGSRPTSSTPRQVSSLNGPSHSRRNSVSASTPKGIKNRKATPRSKNARDGEFFYVERILDKKIHNGKAYYFVKWMGYPSTKNTWEPRESFFSRDIIEDYDRKTNRNRLSHQRRKTISDGLPMKSPLQPLKHLALRADNSPKVSPICDENNRRSTRLLRKSIHTG